MKHSMGYAAMRDPDQVPPGFKVSEMAPISGSGQRSWAILHRQPDASYTAAHIVVGHDIAACVRSIAEDQPDTRFNRSIFQIRPGLDALDYVPPAQLHAVACAA